MRYFVSLLIAGFLLDVCSAQATLVTSISGGTEIAFPTTTYNGGDPQSFGLGITWSSTNSSGYPGPSVFGQTDYYDFGLNGSWQDISMAGLNDSSDFSGISDTMTFEFSSPVMGVGGFMNYYPLSTNPTISVYDSSFSLIESTTLDFFTGGGTNSGMFLGFMEDSNQIKYLTLTDAFVGITNLTVAESSAVPEPATLILLGTGLVGIITARRRK